MNRADTATRKITTAIVVAVALFAAGDSFSHIYELARQHGQGVVSVALLPLAGDEGLRAFRLGLPLPERSVRTSPWLARIHRTTAAGKSWSRIRVAGNPLTEYERYQMHCYPDSARAGEIIWVTSAHMPAGGDFWLFDENKNPFAAVMAYDENGAYFGSEVTADPAIIGRCMERKRFAERYAVPLDTFLRQHAI